MTKAVFFLKKPLELALGSYNVIYGTAVFNSEFQQKVTGVSDADYINIGSLAPGLYFAIHKDNISGILWEDEAGLIDAILSTVVDDSGVLGYLALS